MKRVSDSHRIVWMAIDVHNRKVRVAKNGIFKKGKLGL